MSTKNLNLPTFFTGHVQTQNQVKEAIKILNTHYSTTLAATRFNSHVPLQETIRSVFEEVEDLILQDEGLTVNLPRNLSSHVSLQITLRDAFKLIDDTLNFRIDAQELPAGDEGVDYTFTVTSSHAAGAVVYTVEPSDEDDLSITGDEVKWVAPAAGTYEVVVTGDDGETTAMQTFTFEVEE